MPYCNMFKMQGLLIKNSTAYNIKLTSSHRGDRFGFTFGAVMPLGMHTAAAAQSPNPSKAVLC